MLRTAITPPTQKTKGFTVLPESLTPASKMVVNVVENLACRLAERRGGTITANHLMPYVPLSLALIRNCLEPMTDGHTVYATSRDGFTVYEFAAYHQTPAEAGVLQVGSCVSCGRRFPPNRKRVQCAECRQNLQKALGQLAGKMNWSTEALHEHEILHTAAKHTAPLPIATLASRSRMTLREMKQTLSRMSLDGFLHEELDLDTGVLTYRFPPIEYPQKHYRDNLAAVQACLADTGRGVDRKKRWMVSGLGVGLIAALLYALWPAPSPPLVRSPSPQPKAPPASPESGAMSSPPYGQANHRMALPNAQSVRVSIREQHFSPVEMRIAARWNATTPLSPLRPERIAKEPAYRGQRQMYGTITLGTAADPVYAFAFDLIPGPHPVMYFDINRNGDLTDDGGPLTNQGTGVFATTIRLPFPALIKEVPFPGNFVLWFFTNDRLWRAGSVAHYSRTQLKGIVSLNGKTYTAYIGDMGANDADFTNDGISVDLDGNGKIDRDTEWFLPGAVGRVGDTDYAFHITW